MLLNYRLVLPIAIALLLITASCQDAKYEIREDNQGHIVRLDKTTGEIAVVSGDKLVVLKTPAQQAADQQALEDLKADKTWNSIESTPLRVTFMLQTSWRENYLYYQFRLFPDSSRIKEATSSNWNNRKKFTIELTDGNGFSLITCEIPLSKMISIVDDSGKIIMRESKGSIACSEGTYKSISSWDVQWFL